MGKRGPAGTHPSGTGHTTPKGYHRVWDAEQQRQRLAHNVVWERVNGPIPDDLQVHHRNEDKQDNRIENLELVTTVEHKRIHSPHFRRVGDGWERRCNVCGEWKPADADHWYLSRAGWVLYGRCRPCHIGVVVAAKQQRRQRLS